MLNQRILLNFVLALIVVISLSGCNSSESPESGASSAASPAAVRAPDPVDPAADRAGNLFPMVQQDRWGFMDTQGRVAISATYDMAAEFRGPVAPRILAAR